MSEYSSLDIIDDTPRQAFEILQEVADVRGLTWRFVRVDDVSDVSPTRYRMRERIGYFNRSLAAHPEWKAPEVIINRQGEKELISNNPAAADVYDIPGMLEWRRDLVPSAMALYPLQRPDSEYLPSGGKMDEETRDFFTNALDAVGIRSRAAIMADIAGNYTSQEGETNWTSLACGAAVPVLDAIKNNSDVSRIKLDLIDLDQNALNFAEKLATEQGLSEGDDFILRNRNLVKDLIYSDNLVHELGENSANLVDALGIFEYFKDEASIPFLKNAYRIVQEGGALVIANMLDAHPEIHFNQRGIGWPKIYPRSPENIIALVKQAGIPLDKVTFTVPTDNIYAVLEIKK